jgi:hypothetical protein
LYKIKLNDWSMKSQIATLGVLILSLSLALAQETITFDDLPSSVTSPISSPYQGLNWQNFFAESISDVGIPSGYGIACVSLPNIAYNGGGNSASISISSGTFTLNSGYFSAAWRDGLQMQVEGFLGGTLEYSNSYSLYTTLQNYIDFDYSGVDTVVFSTSGGTPHFSPILTGGNFSMDNLSVTIPEPGAFAMGLTGLFVLLSRCQKGVRALLTTSRCTNAACLRDRSHFIHPPALAGSLRRSSALWLAARPLGADQSAPTDGYVPSFRLAARIRGGQEGEIGNRYFYLRLNGGKEYGRMSINLFAPYGRLHPGLVSIAYAINPSGSRLLW